MSGRRPYWYTYDLHRAQVHRVGRMVGRSEKSLEVFELSGDGKWIAFIGDDGTAVLVSAATKQWVADLKGGHSLRALAFSPDSLTLYAAGVDGRLLHWDLRTRKCARAHMDRGLSRTTSLATSNDGRWLAVGSASGVVNVYDVRNSNSTSTDLGGQVGSERVGSGRQPYEDVAPHKEVLNLTMLIRIPAVNS